MDNWRPRVSPGWPCTPRNSQEVHLIERCGTEALPHPPDPEVRRSGEDLWAGLRGPSKSKCCLQTQMCGPDTWQTLISLRCVLYRDHVIPPRHSLLFFIHRKQCMPQDCLTLPWSGLLTSWPCLGSSLPFRTSWSDKHAQCGFSRHLNQRSIGKHKVETIQSNSYQKGFDSWERQGHAGLRGAKDS